MFFDRLGSPSELTSSSPQASRRRRQFASLGIAIAMALPAGVVGLSRLYADDTPSKDAPRPSTADTLKQAQQQMDQGEYEKAEEALKQVNTSALSDADRHAVLDALTDASKAADQRRAARSELTLGQEALKADRRVEAREHFNTVIGNRFADADTLKQANQDLARADKAAETTDSGAVAAPRLADGVQVADTVAPSPTTQPDAAPAPPAAAVPAIESAPTPPPSVPEAPRMTGAQYYHHAQDQYRKGDWIAARQNFEAARAANYHPGLFEGESPAQYLARMDKKESADRAETERRIARQKELESAKARQVALVQDVPAPAPVPAETPKPEAAVTPAPAPAEAAAPAAVTPAPAPAVAAAPAPTTAPAEAPAPAPAVVATPTPAPTTAPSETAVAPLPVAPPAPAPLSADEKALEDLRATQRAQAIQHQQNAYEAEGLVRQAADAQRQNDLEQARELYTRAVNLDPDNPQAKAGLNQVLILQGRNPTANSALEVTGQRNQVARQEITFQFNKAIQDARDATNRGDFAGADADIQRAQVVSRQDPTIFTTAELANFDAQTRAVQLSLDQARERALATAAQQNDAAARTRLAAEQQASQRQVRKTIEDLRATSMDLTNHQRYREALGVVDQILVLDPNNDYALGVRPLLEDKYIFQQQRIFTERKTLELEKQLVAAEEKKIPYDDVVHYPTDWPDISQKRDQTVAGERGDRKEDRAVQAQLDRALPELTFDGVGFSDVIDFLRDVSGANIFVNWKSLEGAGIDRNAPVTAKLRNIKFAKALSIILDSVGGGTAKLGYTIDEGVIEIATAEELGKNTLTRVYDIRDLIINIPDFDNAPDFSLQSTSNNPGQNGGAGGGGGGGGGGQQQSLFSNSSTSTNQEKTGATRQELVDSIIKLISETVAPDSWRDAGGSVGALRELQGQLIVTQTPESQRAIVNLLEQLRETHSIQVTVETRFLTVQRNFLEDIGVDLNVVINNNQSQSNRFSPVTLNASNSAFTSAPVTQVPGSIGSTATGLSTAVTYLDDLQVNLMLRATQANQLTTLVTAPRVTLFNGQRAFVLVATQQAYVSNLTPSVGTGVSSFTPTISIVSTGVLLDVQATVSADRKYVTLTLRPELSTLLALTNFTFQGSATFASGTAVNNNNNGTIVSQAPNATIQVPEIQLTEVKTTVSVPDGGTLLLGGETVAGEIEKEVGTPVLSKIPFLKRLFTNRSQAKDENILLILVKPTILIEREIEQQQFPLLTSKLGS